MRTKFNTGDHERAHHAAQQAHVVIIDQEDARKEYILASELIRAYPISSDLVDAIVMFGRYMWMYGHHMATREQEG